MKIILLTTDTTHHIYYAWKISEQFPLQAIILETQSVKPPFETFHPFEKDRDKYEQEILSEGFNSTFSDLAETHCFLSVNDRESLNMLASLAPDVIVIFGTGKLLEPIIEIPSVACMNLHGGNPEHYRGLDTHLWAIYHNDFANLVTTLHHVDAQLDTGEIIFQSQLQLDSASKLYQLRAINTKACANLSLLALGSLQSTGQVPSRSQLSRGRYYSFMPAVLKEVCLKRFEKHVARLQNESEYL